MTIADLLRDFFNSTIGISKRMALLDRDLKDLKAKIRESTPQIQFDEVMRRLELQVERLRNVQDHRTTRVDDEQRDLERRLSKLEAEFAAVVRSSAIDAVKSYVHEKSLSAEEVQQLLLGGRQDEPESGDR